MRLISCSAILALLNNTKSVIFYIYKLKNIIYSGMFPQPPTRADLQSVYNSERIENFHQQSGTLSYFVKAKYGYSLMCKAQITSRNRLRQDGQQTTMRFYFPQYTADNFMYNLSLIILHEIICNVGLLPQRCVVKFSQTQSNYSFKPLLSIFLAFSRVTTFFPVLF